MNRYVAAAVTAGAALTILPVNADKVPADNDYTLKYLLDAPAGKQRTKST